MTRLAAPLAQIALHRRSNVVDMPPSSYRPSPPSSRGPSTRERLSQEPDRLLVEVPEPPKTEPTRRSAPEPPREVAEMAGKKKKPRAKVNDETRSVAVARVDKLIEAGAASAEAIAAVAKELGVSDSAIYNWRAAAKKGRPGKAVAGPVVRPKLDGLDLILDIIELCERAKKGLSKSQRVRLRAALNERLS